MKKYDGPNNKQLNDHLKKYHKNIVIDMSKSWIINKGSCVTCPYCDKVIFKISGGKLK